MYQIQWNLKPFFKTKHKPKDFLLNCIPELRSSEPTSVLDPSLIRLFLAAVALFFVVEVAPLPPLLAIVARVLPSSFRLSSVSSSSSSEDVVTDSYSPS